MPILAMIRNQVGFTPTTKSESIVFDVGGTRFETYTGTLKKVPNTKLFALSRDSPNYRPKTNDYYFDRDPSIFRGVLDYYRNGTLHFPNDICATVVRRELDYWGIDEKHVAPCCWEFFKLYSERRATAELLSKAMGFEHGTGRRGRNIRRQSMFEKSRRPLWTYMEDPESSKGALYYSYWICFALLMSVFTTIATESDAMRVPAANPRLRFNDTDNPKMVRFETTDPHPVIVAVDLLLVGFFMSEFIIRAAICPNRWIFFTSSINIVELLAVFPQAIAINLRYLVPDLSSYPKLYFAYWILLMFNIFRVIRLLKFGKYYVGLRILIVTLRASATEMFFLVYLMVVGAVVFGVAFYYCEVWTTATVIDMPTTIYWAFITMTTVGYGDVVPKTIQGKVIAVLCALAGALFTGLAVPVIADNFDRYYRQASVILMRHRLGLPIMTMLPGATKTRDQAWQW